MKGAKPLTDEQAARASASFSGRWARRDRALFVLGLRTGYRIAELLSLRVADVWNGVAVVDEITVQRRRMKGRIASRTVPLHDEARAALAAWIDELLGLEGAGADTPLFCSRQRPRRSRDRLLPFDVGGTGGLPSRSAARRPRRPITYQQANAVLKSACARAGVTGRCSTHSLRKTFARRVHRRFRGDLLKTQRALGHQSVSSTQHYLATMDEEIDEGILSA